MKNQNRHNKRMKGSNAQGSEAGRFKKNNMLNCVPIGVESTSRHGYVWVKVAEPNIWKPKHYLVWERVNGALPPAKVLIFGDGNKRNFDISNLIPVTRAQLIIMNRHHYILPDSLLTRLGTVLANLLLLINKRKTKKDRKKL